MRPALVSASLLCSSLFIATTAPSRLAGQEDVAPPGLAALELERSRTCVGTIAEIAAVNSRLEPIMVRGRRLRALSNAILLEDRASVEPLDASKPAEVRVRDWFQTDAALAQRYVASPNPGLLAEREAGRETIKAFVNQEIGGAEDAANAILDQNQDLLTRAGPCDGAIFVRSAVEEACATGSGPLCEQVALPASEVQGFRFVDAPENIWDVRELRPWTAPTPLRAGPGGQLEGGRTIGYARVGNVVFTLAFTPLLRNRAELTSEQIARFEAVNDSLGLSFSNAQVAFTPALGLRVALPQPLAGESRYIIHFGAPNEPDVVWMGESGTGRPIEATLPLNTRHVLRLQAGEALSLTAVGGPEGNQLEYTIGLSNVNQSQSALVLLNYMRSQLSADVAALMAPVGG